LAYIGNIPADKYTSFAKQDFTVTATTSYTLDHSVSNENEIALFINFVRQEPTTAYTASGTSLTLTEATSVGDDMYCVFIGKAVQTVTPASSTITNDMLSETITVANGGTGLTSGFKNGITMADQWRLSADTNIGTNADVTANWERNDDASYGSIGTGLTESSGIFSFPSTGIYLIVFAPVIVAAGSDTSANIQLDATQDNSSSYDSIARINMGNGGTNAAYYTGSMWSYFDVTDITNDKFKFATSSFATNTRLIGNTGRNASTLTVIRLGDT